MSSFTHLGFISNQYEDFSVPQKKRDILKNMDGQKVLVPFDKRFFFCEYSGSKWEPKLSGHQHSSKYYHT